MDQAPPLAPPPRHVPPSLRWRVLLGGVPAVIGWPILLVGGFLATMFVGNSELATAWRFSTELATTRGEVVRTEPTSSRVNGRRVHHVVFAYEVDGRSFEGLCYSTGDRPAAGSEATVEYVPGEPTTARIRGMRTAAFPALVAFVLVLPLIATVVIGIGWRRGRRRVHLLRCGNTAWAVLTGRERTSTRINQASVYRLTFTFVDEQGTRRTAIGHSHRSDWFDERVARCVLYDPATDAADVVDLMPGRPRIVDRQWAPAGKTALLAVLILPALTLLALYAASHVRL